MSFETDQTSNTAVAGVAARRWKRYVIETRVKIFALRNKVRILCLGYSDNLSEGGMGFYCPQALEMNERIDIELELPAAKFPVKISGFVRSYVNEVYGVEFCDMGARQKDEILRACRALAQLQG
ncbi:MAG TPA: PilZ domain-containing protein [Ktedonobacteraceae bacterium]|nr:PilZ domain-containing protein [Ktedonobacteraceae bacterium]